MTLVNVASRRIQAIRVILMDLHDPSGVYFHRAWSACLAGLIAAGVLYCAGAIAQPLLVVAAIIFMHTTRDPDCPRKPIVLLGSLIAALLNASLLSLTRFQPVLQGAVMIGSGLLAQYLTQFSQAFSAGTLTWILSVIASTENPTVEQLPLIWLNLTLGFLIAYLCHFWIAPYRPHRVWLSVLKRTRLRLATRLQQAVDELNPQSDWQQLPERQADTNLDRPIVSLMNTQNALLKKLVQQQVPGEAIPSQEERLSISHYREMITAHEALFEAILVLEQSLLILKATPDIPLTLQLSLTQLSRRASQVLEQASSLQRFGSPLQLDSDFEQWLQAFVGDRYVSPQTQIQRQNTYQAIQTLLSQINSVAAFSLGTRRTGNVP